MNKKGLCTIRDLPTSTTAQYSTVLFNFDICRLSPEPVSSTVPKSNQSFSTLI